MLSRNATLLVHLSIRNSKHKCFPKTSSWNCRLMCAVYGTVDPNTSTNEPTLDAKKEQSVKCGKNEHVNFTIGEIPDTVRSGAQITDIESKYPYLRRKKIGNECVVEADYGLVRLDTKPLSFREKKRIRKERKRGQESRLVENHEDFYTVPFIEEEIQMTNGVMSKYPTENLASNNNPSAVNAFDVQYFAELETREKSSEPKAIKSNSAPKVKEGHVFDSQYFGDYEAATEVTEKISPPDALIHDTNIFESQYFANESKSSPLPEIKDIVDLATNQMQENIIKQQSVDEIQNRRMDTAISESRTDSSNFFDDQYFTVTKQTLEQESIEMPQEKPSTPQNHVKLQKRVKPVAEFQQTADDIVVMPLTKANLRRKTQPVANLDNPKTAYDVAMKMRMDMKKENSFDDKPKKETMETFSNAPNKQKWLGRTDSQGFRILKDQTTNLEYATEDIVISKLKESVLYEDDKIVAIDKPYGLPSHGGPGVHHSVGRYAAALGKKIDPSLDKLHLVHRLDRGTTGVMLLAKSAEALDEVRGYFRRQEVGKVYWAITKNVPSPQSGIIDIPMAETTVKGKVRMGLRPAYTEDTKVMMKSAKNVKKFDAVTEYNVLDSYGNAALVECRPKTGVKHQIRCHLAYGLNTPILGDHKYSHFSRLAPQKLPSDMLQRLHIRQPLVRYVPLLLHARTIVLPEYAQGRNLFISARLHRHFVQNMKWLKVKPPKMNLGPLKIE